MGTEIQANTLFSKNHHVSDLTGNTRNGLRPLCHGNQITRNGQDHGALMTWVFQNGCLVHDIETVRQTILKHESIFKNQLLELHRLHKRQRDLMNEIEIEEKKKATNLTLARLGDVSINSFSNSHLEPKEFFKDSYHGMDKGLSLCNFGLIKTGNEHLLSGHAVNFLEKRRMDEDSDTRDFCSAKSQLPFETLSVPRNEVLSSPFELGKSSCRKKRKIFGVEIFEGNYESCNAASNTSTKMRRNDLSNSQSFWTKESITSKQKTEPHLDNLLMVSNEPSSWNSNSFIQNLELVGKNVKDGCADLDRINPRGGLPWFLKNTQHNGEPSKGIKNSYFMNLDSLQNCSPAFSSNAEIADGSFLNLKQKKEILATTDTLFVEGGRMDEISNNGNCTKMIFGFPILNNGGGIVEVKQGENDSINQLEKKNLDCISKLRHHIDLNLSLNEEDAAPSVPSLLKAIVKIATTEIDLESPAMTEFETDTFPEEEAMPTQKLELSDEESDKLAADALIYISCSGKKSLSDDKLAEAKPTDCLKWFAEIISCQRDDSSEDTVAKSMDYFEVMTLKLQDITDEHRLYTPMVMNIPSDHEEGRICKGSRRRGRQQKDFQKDILPGLVTLSRREMKEDLKTFKEIRRVGGSRHCLRSNSAKKGKKGKKRFVVPSTSVPVKPVSLIGWGKRTRRLPRQRCTNLVYLSLPVKC